MKNLFCDIEIIYKEELEKLFNQKGLIAFRTNIEPEIIDLVFISDIVRLKQIIINLINNAIKFTHSGYIEFNCKLIENSSLLFCVKDTGIGIKKENCAIIFERFRKVEDNENEIFRGTGIGLAIVKQLVELLNGKIWLESEYGKGSAFYFTIPVSMPFV